MNTVLAFDTATEALSVALKHNESITSHFELAPRLHAQKLLPTIERLLHEQGLQVSDVDAFVFGRGPGAFTGVRTAIGVVQGLALAFDRPCIGISTLEALAEGARRRLGVTNVLPSIDARMGEVYISALHWRNGAWRLLADERVCPPAAFAFHAENAFFTCGSGWQTYHDALSTAVQAPLQHADQMYYPEALDMLNLALPRLTAGQGVPAEQAMPVYLRDKVAETTAERNQNS
ncbi:tRNA (adenosine(37)-N6)-threonylcarbamoyltransferase complex dimerization subunit type 1 TsaB [Permianibacter aggregans]|uniref:tRNA threonylcarbamoyladenosine biosynthesis protein TsaB n=1 Tax=Permianibacter aggregans TaxID=1510150 RepID=A0A4R6UQM6_9GAMM|nr:tRNA (adenosine(37)-N6)-threonylcarbamoyltransferase complex dimerization subunit type 1 TsaB [Permianibacter aggregans]QGX38450.1 tRNA (adenosine(37)-N6)-threonylcarbamoyltransferase complex dimerization subunit type 1 TsaB [Permianibacter aggregans]TDQ45564.1 tRNA threonylcarbamoyladenosine biosynthesis protein TsaB [Permianibacter aggregans]